MLLAYLSAVVALALGPAKAAKGPTLPFSDVGACPFECCRYGPWTARVRQRAYKARTAAAGVAFMVRPGEQVDALTGMVITRKAGLVIVRKQTTFDDNFTVPAGAKLFVLHGFGEGDYLFWYNGSTHRGGLYAETVGKGNARYPFDVLSVPQVEWWVKVQTSRGATGWILDPQDFHGMDACGN
jgi:hypothetical protein